MKILFITEHFPPKIDGVVTRLTHTIRLLKACNIEVTVITNNEKFNQSLINIEDSVKVYRLPSFSLPFYPQRRVVIPTRKIKKIITHIRPDIIHVINLSFCGFYSLKIAKKFHIFSVASQHTNYAAYLDYYYLGSFKALLWKGITKILTSADRALCTSIEMYNLLKKRGVIDLKIWQPGVATDEILPSFADIQLKKQLVNNQLNHFLLIYVGRLSAEKNIGLIKYALMKNPNIHLAIIGQGPQEKSLMKLFSGTRTTFIKPLHGKDLAIMYATADAVILPSATETLGLVLLEAMSAATPALGANAGGIPTIIQDGKNGFLFQPYCERAISLAITKLMQLDRNKLLDLKNNARKTAEKWSWKEATNQLINIYKNRY